MDSEETPLNDGSARSVLVLDSDVAPPSFGPVSPTSSRLLAVDFTPRSTGDPDRWERRLDVRSTELVVVTTETRDPDAVGADAVEQVNSPADLTGLGVKASKHLSRWADDTTSTPMVVFDSLTILLQYAGLQAVFRFLHTLTTRIANVDGHGVFFLDSVTQDDKAVHTFASLFDAVARWSGGEWDVSLR